MSARILASWGLRLSTRTSLSRCRSCRIPARSRCSLETRELPRPALVMASTNSVSLMDLMRRPRSPAFSALLSTYSSNRETSSTTFNLDRVASSCRASSKPLPSGSLPAITTKSSPLVTMFKPSAIDLASTTSSRWGWSFKRSRNPRLIRTWSSTMAILRELLTELVLSRQKRAT